MNIGLKRGTVELRNYDPAWASIAQEVIEQLTAILGSLAIEIQHVGSTAIKGIKAKPIIDIALAVDDLELNENIVAGLNKAGYFKSKSHRIAGDVLYCDGDEFAETRSFHIHIVKCESKEWKDYICFKDYLNKNEEAAKEYEKVKIELANLNLDNRITYTEGKNKIIAKLLEEAKKMSDL